MPESSNRPTTWVTTLGVGLVCLFLLSAAYYGAFLLALDPGSRRWLDGEEIPAFRNVDSGSDDDKRMRTFFGLAYVIDKTIRPDRWKTKDEFDALVRPVRRK